MVRERAKVNVEFIVLKVKLETSCQILKMNVNVNKIHLIIV